MCDSSVIIALSAIGRIDILQNSSTRFLSQRLSIERSASRVREELEVIFIIRRRILGLVLLVLLDFSICFFKALCLFLWGMSCLATVCVFFKCVTYWD